MTTERPPSPPEAEAAPRRQRPKHRLLLLIATGLLLLLGIIGYVLYTDYQSFLDTPLAGTTDQTLLQVKPGMGIADIVQELRRQPGLTRSLPYLESYVRLNRLALRLKAGQYALSPGITPRTLLDNIVAGRVIQYGLTVVEGWTFRQLRQAVATHPNIIQTVAAVSDAELMAKLERPGQHPEGRFLADTYHFPAGTTDVAFLRRALVAMERQLDEVWQQRIPDLPFNEPYQALILASIVEKETALPSERAAIAGVFVRRLRKGMLLQTDPTVIYGLGTQFDGNVRRRDLTTDTPYNTYTRKGLPPTPIALPGKASLQAAVNPAPGETLYFVASGSGGHVFSTTLAEHNRAVKQYLLKQRER